MYLSLACAFFFALGLVIIVLSYFSFLQVANSFFFATAGWENIGTDSRFDRRYGLQCTTFENYIFVSGGRSTSNSYFNDLWSSNDGGSMFSALN